MHSHEKLIAGSAFLVLLVCTILGFFSTSEFQHILDNVHWFVTNTTLFSLAWLGFRKAQQPETFAKKWFFTGAAFYLLGGLFWLFQEISGKTTFPDTSDILYLAFGPCMAIGFVLATKTQLSGSKVLAFSIDSLSFTAAILGFVLVLYLPSTSDVSNLDLFVLTAYPVTLLSAACILLLLIPYLRPTFMLPWLLLTIGLFLDGGAWMQWNLNALNHANTHNQILNKLFSISDILVGLGIYGWFINPSKNKRYRFYCNRILKLVPLIVLLLSASTFALIIIQSGNHPFAHYIAAMAIVSILVFSSIRQSILLVESDRLLDAKRMLELKERENLNLVQFDPLTGLPNRSQIQSRLERALIKASSEGSPIALLCMDINRFKSINDSYGHHIGDLFMQEVASRFREATEGVGSLGRLESDKFILIIEENSHLDYINHVISLINASFQNPINIDIYEYITQACIGISMFPQDANNANELIRNATTALNKTKLNRTSLSLYYSKEFTLQAKSKLNLDVNLRKAIDNDEFFLEFQPIFSYNNHRLEVSSIEALIRWKLPSGEVLLPGHFILYAEEIGLIFTIGEWVIKESCKQLAWINRQLKTPIRLSINISPKQFREQRLAEIISNALAEFGIEPNLITLEITESAIFDHENEAIEMLHALKSLNVEISLDDFGVGHSSLFKLKQLPIDEIKLDKAFLVNAPQNRQDAEIVTTVSNIAKILSLSLVIEGVETIEQYDFVKKMQCDKMQGFLLCKPTNPYHLIDLIQNTEADFALSTE